MKYIVIKGVVLKDGEIVEGLLKLTSNIESVTVLDEAIDIIDDGEEYTFNFIDNKQRDKTYKEIKEYLLSLNNPLTLK